MSSRVWIATELYYPEETSTGFLLTRIAEGLAKSHDVGVICGQPTYAMRGSRAPSKETHNGVHIIRCPSTTLDKNKLPARLLNILTLSASIFFTALANIRRTDLVLVVTNPPVLPFVVTVAAKLHGARVTLIVHDVYPEVLTVAGLAGPESLITRIAGVLTRSLYRTVHRIVVLGRDMRDLALTKLDTQKEKVVLIRNWADLGDVTPSVASGQAVLADFGIKERFVAQYAGNMGRTHDLESIVEAARSLADERSFHFLLFGSGAKYGIVEGAIVQHALRNVTMGGAQPRSEQQRFLNACDVALITFMPGVAGVSVPSRMYNVMAAGKPIVAMTDDESELARVVRENDIGWVVAPRDWRGLVAALREARTDAERLRSMGVRARHAAETEYSYEHVIRLYEELVAEQV